MSVAGPGLSPVLLRGLDRTEVAGVDYDEGRLGQARAGDNPANLAFVDLDATKSVPPGEWDVVVLSNVLEHIVDRVGLLTTLVAHTHAKKFLIRVPHFERDWKMPMRRAVGANYYSDPITRSSQLRRSFATKPRVPAS